VKGKPIVNYDPKGDVLYIVTKKGEEESMTEIAPGVNVELDEREKLLVSRYSVPQNFLSQLLNLCVTKWN